MAVLLDGTINQNGIDVTREFLEDSKKYTIRKDVVMNSKEIFIVHGHDEAIKYELARIIDKEFHLEAKIYHEEPDKGRTIIEKLEGVSELPGYAFILLTQMIWEPYWYPAKILRILMILIRDQRSKKHNLNTEQDKMLFWSWDIL